MKEEIAKRDCKLESTGQHYRVDLQILRGFSVVLVFLYHLDIPGFANGYLGVDIFFVLSGYLMALLTERATPSEFYKRRLRRLLPAYLATIFLTTLIVSLTTFPNDANQRLARLWFDLFGLSNFAFWFENSYFQSTNFTPLLNLWSLGVEIQFYLIAPFLLPFLRKKPLVLVSSVILSLAASLIVLKVSHKTSFFMTPTRLWEFLIGAGVAWYPIQVAGKFRKIMLFYVALFTVFGTLFFYPIEGQSFSVLKGHPGLAVFLVVISAGFIISVTFNEFFWIDNAVGRFFAKLGDYSYSIYLTHFPVITLVNYEAWGGTRLGAEGIEKLILIVVIVLFSSFLMFKYVEVFRFKKRIFVPISILSTAIIGVGIFGSNLNRSLYTHEQNLVFKAWEDRAPHRCRGFQRIFSMTSYTCRLGLIDNEDRVLLLGDSLADSIKVAFTDAMTKHNNSTYFLALNAPLRVEGQNAKRIADEVTRLDIGRVVVHFSGGVFLESESLERLKRFMSLMAQNQVAVYFIAPVPSYDAHIPKAMIAHGYDPNYSLPNKSVGKYFEENAGFFDFIKENGVGKPKVFFPHEILCPNGFCKIANQYTPYYYDNHHLTLTGANQLRPLLDSLAENLVR